MLDISPTLTEAAGAIVDVMSDEFSLQSFNLFIDLSYKVLIFFYLSKHLKYKDRFFFCWVGLIHSVF